MSFNHYRVKAIHPNTYRGGGFLAHDGLKLKGLLIDDIMEIIDNPFGGYCV